MSNDGLLNQLRDDAKSAYQELYKQFRDLLSDSHFRPRLKKTQKRQEFETYLNLPPEQQAVILARMEEQRIDTPTWLAERQKLMEG